MANPVVLAGFNDKTFVDNFRTPHSEKLHLVERLRLVDDGKAEVTIEDPAVFLQPLQVTKRARRVDATLAEWRCAAGEMNILGIRKLLGLLGVGESERSTLTCVAAAGLVTAQLSTGEARLVVPALNL
jgi:hypothetical protein